MIRHHDNLIQGSAEWLAARCGLLTASEIKLILTPTLRRADNNHSRAHVFELLAQRISRHVEPGYVSDDMLRGREDEVEARILYAQHYAPVHEVGFITNDRWGFTLGYSPDGMVGSDGLIECKSRRQRLQVQSIVECFAPGRCPAEFILQVQTGLLVSERAWCDLVSYSGGLPMMTVRVHPDEAVQAAILEAAADTEKQIAAALARYDAATRAGRLIPTERRIEQEMFVS